MSFNLVSILERVVREDPDRPLVRLDSEVRTYGQVHERARRVAGGLLARGLRPGDRVLVQLPNVPEFLDVYFGILAAGLVMVPVNPLLSVPEVVHHLTDSGAGLYVTDAACAERAEQAADGIPLVVVGEDGPRAFTSLADADPVGNHHPTDPGDTAVVLYTSGTTGRPKGAKLTHFQLFMNCTAHADLLRLGRADVVTAVLPLFHVFGLSTVLGVTVRAGVSLVLMDRFAADAVLDAVERYRITVFAGVPTMYIALLAAEPGDRDLRSLRLGVSGGAAMPVEVIRGLEERFPELVLLEAYGLSETASAVCSNVDAERRRIGSIGRPLWGVEVRIVDDAGRFLGPGPEHVGEIVVRGHSVMKGYLGRPEATAEVVRDGWFHTGDLGYRDADGFLYVVDRLKDLIIRGGYNVYPREVEEVLYGHPDVLEAAVVGRADPRLGEEVIAHVVLRPGSTTDAAELDAHARASLAAYKYPREFRLVERLPKGATGKILKRELRGA